MSSGKTVTLSRSGAGGTALKALAAAVVVGGTRRALAAAAATPDAVDEEGFEAPAWVLNIPPASCFFGGSGGADSDDDDAEIRLEKSCFGDGGISGVIGEGSDDVADKEEDDVLDFGNDQEWMNGLAVGLDGVGGNV